MQKTNIFAATEQIANQVVASLAGGMRECSKRASHTRAVRHDDHQSTFYLAIDAWAAAIFAFTASRLKLAPLCIGGNSIAVMASFSTSCCTNTKRQNSYLNHSKYCCAPTFVPLSGQPVRSKG